MSSLPPTWSGMTPPQKAVWWHSAVGASSNFSMSINACSTNFSTSTFGTIDPEPDPLEQAVRYARGQKIVELLRAGRLRITRKSTAATFLPWSPKYVQLPTPLYKYLEVYHKFDEEKSGLGYFGHKRYYYGESGASLLDSVTGISILDTPNYKGYRPILEDE